MRAAIVSIPSSLFVASIVAVAGAACSAAGSSVVVAGPDGGPSSDEAGIMTDGGTTLDDGSTGTADYASLFGPPASTNATADSVFGLWAGTDIGGQDTRIVIKASSLVIAKKCANTSSPMTAGITVVSQITSSSLRTLESKSGPMSTDLTCGLGVKVVSVPRCTSVGENDAAIEGGGLDDGCFYLSGTKLNFYSQTLLGGTKLNKLSD